ncbi:hypothetical protein, partial [Pseudomonas sp. 1239]|uniref:hypothetical protein n=1 Tax=Pseudomonas sp. 1239 TaxID=1985343 RepID=UPI001C43E5A9
AGLLALTGVLGIGEGHLFHHRKARRLVSGDFAKSGSLFQDFPKEVIQSSSGARPGLVGSYVTAQEVIAEKLIGLATALHGVPQQNRKPLIGLPCNHKVFSAPDKLHLPPCHQSVILCSCLHGLSDTVKAVPPAKKLGC